VSDRGRSANGPSLVVPPPESVHGADVVSLGAHLVDVLALVEDDPRMPGTTRVARQVRATAAGTAAATSVDLAKLGVTVEAIGAVGDDELGDLLVWAMRRHGVGTSLLVRRAGAPTSTSVVTVSGPNDRSVTYARGADRGLDEDDLGDAHHDAIRSARVLHIGGPDALGRFAGRPLTALVEEAKAHGAIITVDLLQPASQVTFERLERLLALCDWFFPNDQQLLEMTGAANLAEAVSTVRSLGDLGVAVTCGTRGCQIATPEGTVLLPSIPVEAVDATGCGDAFSAGFIKGLLLGCDPVECGWLATSCGSLVATGLGSDAGIIDLDQVFDHLEKHASTGFTIRSGSSKQ
jgi:sugar/nucleoside kinase (ribokinase family)